MRFPKRLATFIVLLVTLSACAPKSDNSPANALYPVTSHFSWNQRVAWCQGLGLNMSDPSQDQPCTNLFLVEVRDRVTIYYNRQYSIWDICQGNPGICLEPSRMEDHARDYHQ